MSASVGVEVLRHVIVHGPARTLKSLDWNPCRMYAIRISRFGFEALDTRSDGEAKGTVLYRTIRAAQHLAHHRRLKPK